MDRLSRRDKIREFNDVFRQTFLGGRVMLTAGVNALPPETKASVIVKVQNFATFTADNDPHGQHDFGSFDHDGNKFFWKIDCYNKSMDGGSEDFADPTKTTRVLTIMLAEEY